MEIAGFCERLTRPCICYFLIGERFLIPLGLKLFIWLSKGFAYPRKVRVAIRDLTTSPRFEVCNGKTWRQGCTLSLLLFISLQMVLLHDIQKEYLQESPLASRPLGPHCLDIDHFLCQDISYQNVHAAARPTSLNWIRLRASR